MRIACVYLPSFPLQVHVRRAPYLAGECVVVTRDARSVSDSCPGPERHPVVIACSRLAWKCGIRPGFAVSRARALAPDLVVQNDDEAIYRAAAHSIGDSLLSLSPTVDLDEPTSWFQRNRAIYVHVPTGTRGDNFARQILARLNRQGFRARVGIADDRFCAWVAAATSRGVRLDDDSGAKLFAATSTSVQRGGSGTFLAKLPLGLLPVDADVLAMLQALHIDTLGDFAALPPPSMGQRWNDSGVDLRVLAAGDDPTRLRPFTPSSHVAERSELERPIDSLEPLTFVLRPLIDRICDRLHGRNCAAERLEIRLIGAADYEHVCVTTRHATLSGRALADQSRAALAKHPFKFPIEAIEVAVTRESDLDSLEDGGEADLFDRLARAEDATPGQCAHTASERPTTWAESRAGHVTRLPADQVTPASTQATLWTADELETIEQSNLEPILASSGTIGDSHRRTLRSNRSNRRGQRGKKNRHRPAPARQLFD